MKEGSGLYSWREGAFKSYDGDFRDNQMHGKAVQKLTNGTYWSGFFDCTNDFQINNAECTKEDRSFQGSVINGMPQKGFVIANNGNLEYNLTLKNDNYYGKTMGNNLHNIF